MHGLLYNSLNSVWLNNQSCFSAHFADHFNSNWQENVMEIQLFLCGIFYAISIGMHQSIIQMSINICS